MPVTIDMTGKLAIVTGATSGLGFETALGLARAGATVIVAARNPQKAKQAVATIQREAPTAKIRPEHLELGSLESVKQFAAAIIAGYPAVHVLINNGAVMALPRRDVTQDGFEQQVGVNYLSHFALTGQLLPVLNAGGGRVVNVASVAHRRAALGLDDFQSERSYGPMAAYGRSKLAMLVFALELQRRADSHGWNIKSIAAHPGLARTSIVSTGMGRGLRQRIFKAGFNAVAQSARAGALPLLFAAGAPDAKGGAYYGPTGWGETRGAPGPARIFPQAADAAAGSALWALSEKLTGVTYDLDRRQGE